MNNDSKRPKLILETSEPISGDWDGGAKSRFEFVPEAIYDTPEGDTIKWGCWGANFWYNAGMGKSWKHAATIARKRLARLFHPPSGITYTIEIVWE